MIVPPGSTIGIVGGGQLGRMLAAAAAQLGYKCHIYAPDARPPAAEVAARASQGSFDDAKALRAFGRQVDVATFEFENVSTGGLAALAEEAPLHPPIRALDIARDRLAEKDFVRRLGGKVPLYTAVDSRAGLDAALAEVGAPAILKTRRFGYDGKGQARIAGPADAGAAWSAVGGQPSILESLVPYDAEFSVLLCRGANGELVCWDAPRNVHTNGILDCSAVPAPRALYPAILAAEALARRVAEALDYVGTLAMEFFAVGDEALFNEMAPRVHNSGHWTIEGALTSQFENHVRAICGLPLGATDRTAPRVEMRNLIGDDVKAWRALLTDRAAHLHLYGKREPRPGRKMGHVTRLFGVGEEPIAG